MSLIPPGFDPSPWVRLVPALSEAASALGQAYLDAIRKILIAQQRMRNAAVWAAMIEARRDEVLRMHIEGERQEGLRFIRREADRVRVELGLVPVHHPPLGGER